VQNEVLQCPSEAFASEREVRRPPRQRKHFFELASTVSFAASARVFFLRACFFFTKEKAGFETSAITTLPLRLACIAAKRNRGEGIFIELCLIARKAFLHD